MKQDLQDFRSSVDNVITLMSVEKYMEVELANVDVADKRAKLTDAVGKLIGISKGHAEDKNIINNEMYQKAKIIMAIISIIGFAGYMHIFNDRKATK